MALAKSHKANLDTLIKAARAGRLAVVECQDKATGKAVAVICALGDAPNKEIDIVPFAKMFDGNPYDELNPPDHKGGFRG